MRIDEVIWLERVEDKIISKHGVYPYEVNDLIDNNPLINFVEKGHVTGEDVYAAFGQSYGGRYLVAYFIYKFKKQALILSARDMSRHERKRYERKK